MVRLEKLTPYIINWAERKGTKELVKIKAKELAIPRRVWEAAMFVEFKRTELK